MKKIYTLFLFGFIVSNVFSQQVLKSPFVAAADKCGFSAEMEKNRVRGFNDAAYEAEMQRLINEFKQLNNFGPPTTIFSVPIIFHVIYDGNTESTIGTGANLTQAIVTAQIQQLNADFANLSGSGYGSATDLGVRFVAAKVDPMGNLLCEPLSITQDDVRCDGHAIEVRVVAEDPAAGWLPSTGLVDGFSIDGPSIEVRSSTPMVRTDTGIRAGTEVSADYDSLLAKVIAHAPTRSEAARQLARALRLSGGYPRLPRDRSPGADPAADERQPGPRLSGRARRSGDLLSDAHQPRGVLAASADPGGRAGAARDRGV